MLCYPRFKKTRALTTEWLMNICCLNSVIHPNHYQLIYNFFLQNPKNNKNNHGPSSFPLVLWWILRSLQSSERPHFPQPPAKTTPPAQVRWQKIRWPPSPQGIFFKTKNRPWPKGKREIVFQPPFFFSGCVSFREGGMQSVHDQVVPKKKKSNTWQKDSLCAKEK